MSKTDDLLHLIAQVRGATAWSPVRDQPFQPSDYVLACCDVACLEHISRQLARSRSCQAYSKKHGHETSGSWDKEVERLLALRVCVTARIRAALAANVISEGDMPKSMQRRKSAAPEPATAEA